MKLQSDPRRLVVPLAVSLLAGGGSATAASYTYDGYGVTNEQNIHVLSPRDIAGGSGQIVLTGSGAYAGVNLPAWCLDIYNYLATSGSYQSPWSRLFWLENEVSLPRCRSRLSGRNKVQTHKAGACPRSPICESDNRRPLPSCRQ
jgi:hypothetical protein